MRKIVRDCLPRSRIRSFRATVASLGQFSWPISLAWRSLAPENSSERANTKKIVSQSRRCDYESPIDFVSSTVDDRPLRRAGESGGSNSRHGLKWPHHD